MKDARTGYEMGNTQAVLDGELDPFIREYLLARAAGEDRLDGELHFPEPSHPGASVFDAQRIAVQETHVTATPTTARSSTSRSRRAARPAPRR